MATSSKHSHPGEPTASAAEPPFLALRIDHRFAPGLDETAPDVIAAILSRSCFAAIHRVASERRDGTHSRFHKRSAAAMAEQLRDSSSVSLCGESSNDKEMDAVWNIETGRNREAQQVYPAPLISRMILPHDPAQTQARLQAFCELGTVLRAVFGCLSLEPTFREASRVSNGLPPRLPVEDALKRPGMTERRIRERHGFMMFPEELGRSIPGPEWGVFLSGEHLAQLPGDVLRPGEVFAVVKRLADALVYLQLTDDPADALGADYDARLESARTALSPILMDVSAIDIG